MGNLAYDKKYTKTNVNKNELPYEKIITPCLENH